MGTPTSRANWDQDPPRPGPDWLQGRILSSPVQSAKSIAAGCQWPRLVNSSAHAVPTDLVVFQKGGNTLDVSVPWARNRRSARDEESRRKCSRTWICYDDIFSGSRMPVTATASFSFRWLQLSARAQTKLQPTASKRERLDGSLCVETQAAAVELGYDYFVRRTEYVLIGRRWLLEAGWFPNRGTAAGQQLRALWANATTTWRAACKVLIGVLPQLDGQFRSQSPGRPF